MGLIYSYSQIYNTFKRVLCLSGKWLVYEEHLQCMRVNMIFQRDDEKHTSWDGKVNVKVERTRICSKPISLEGRTQNCFEKIFHEYVMYNISALSRPLNVLCIHRMS